MLVSVIIPCYNSQDTIKKTLHSVMIQTYRDFEIILVDDGSTDETQHEIEKFFDNKMIDYKYIYQENSGPSSARNNGVQNASGEYIAFLDSDDEWHPQKLEITINLFKKYSIDMVGHNCSLKNNFNVKYTAEKIKKISFYQLLFKNFAVTPSVVVRKNILMPFNEDMKYAEDYELWLRMSLKNDIYYYEDPLVLLGRKPLSSGGLSESKWQMRKGEIKMYFFASKYSRFVLAILPFLVVFSLIKHVVKLLK